MIKQNKNQLILTSIVMLIPVIIGLLLWNRLPEQIPSHWDINGNVDQWSSKPFAVFAFPAILLALHWICVIASTTDPKHKNYHPKMITLVLWICPAIGLLLCAMVYPAALGYTVPVETIMPLFMGALFMVIGNWMPKCKQTYTMGIKLPWTLASEENWNATHRFGGKVWFFGGILSMLTSFLGNFWLLMVILLMMVILPTIYSYRYYLKHRGDEA